MADVNGRNDAIAGAVELAARKMSLTEAQIPDRVFILGVDTAGQYHIEFMVFSRDSRQIRRVDVDVAADKRKILPAISAMASKEDRPMPIWAFLDQKRTVKDQFRQELALFDLETSEQHKTEVVVPYNPT